jgi:hypothetical protein
MRLSEACNCLVQACIHSSLLLLCLHCLPHCPSAVQDFFLRLSDAEEIDKCLVLPKGLYFMGRKQRGSGGSIFIRDSYCKLEKFIRDAVELPSEEGGYDSVVITGTPGIGKSCYAFYWMWRLLNEGKSVVYQLDSKFYFVSKGSVECVHGLDAADNAGFFSDPEAWFLCDPEKEERPYRHVPDAC